MTDSLQPIEGLFDRLVFQIGRWVMPRSLQGSLALTLPSGRYVAFGDPQGGVNAHLHVKNYRVLWASMRRGALGFFESFMSGDLNSTDLTALFKFYIHNRQGLDKASRGLFFSSLFDKLWHLGRDNTREGSKQNIAAHYDLGNAFYQLWLDETVTYSSAVFDETPAGTLEDAQQRKYKKIMEAMEFKAGDHVLEIGCGWGGFAEAAAKCQAKLSGITLSREQLAFARDRMQKKGLSAACDLRFEDYRDTQGQFDGIASIEMIEAVGERHWPVYFKTLSDRLKPGGIAAVQAITITEAQFTSYRAGVDFIQRYVFPGGMLLTKSIIREQAERVGLFLEKAECFGQSYARTLKLWHERFEAAWPEVAKLGFDDRFKRLWKLYLSYCEAGFAEGLIDVGIYRLRKAV